MISFEWDASKAADNLKKHGIHFADAVGVFEDDNAITVEDCDAEGEQRFCTIGCDFTFKILLVVYTYRYENTIRLISARKATRKEREQYEKGI